MVETSSAVVNSTIPVSTKYTVNMGKWLRGDKVDKAIDKLERMIKHEIAMPCVVNKKNISHKRGGIGPGKYPEKIAKFVLIMLEQVKSNAKAKGLDEKKLVISEFIPNMAVSKEHREKYKTGALTHLKIGVVVEK